MTLWKTCSRAAWVWPTPSLACSTCIVLNNHFSFATFYHRGWRFRCLSPYGTCHFRQRSWTSMTIRALIVDDEPLARQSVRRFLKDHLDVQVLGECCAGQSAVDTILANNLDLVFLDVQMPELDGFAVINRVGADRMPGTIFVTAYDQYALAAFDANALDYLLKPFGKARFDRALARARERIALQVNRESLQRFLEAMEGIGTSRNYIDRLPVTENGRIVFVKTADIEWIESARNYTRVHAHSRHHDIRETLS